MTKRLLIGLLVLGICVSCSNNATFPESYPQKWKLVKMGGSFSDSVTTGDQMAWQESYVLRSDNTVTKSRNRNGVMQEINGSYKLEKSSDGTYLRITYNSASDIIGSCNSKPQELLFLNNEEVFKSTWQNCDGPVLEYKRIE